MGMLVGSFCAVAMGAGLLMVGDSHVPSQHTSFRVRGDTSGAPVGCSAAMGTAAIAAWFTAFENADSAGLARALGTSRSDDWVFSTGKFTPSDTFVRMESIS